MSRYFTADELVNALRQAERLLRAAGFAMTGTASSQIVAAIAAHAAAARHAESSKEVAVPGWEQRVNAVAPALRVKTKEQAMEAEIAGWRALAAQQAAAPGALDQQALHDMFERDAATHLGIDHAINRTSFRRDDDGGYQYAATRRLFALWKAAREAAAHSARGTPEAPADPLDTALPCDIKVGNGTIRKGCKLRTLVARMESLHRMAMAALPVVTPEQRAEFDSLFPRAVQLEGGQKTNETGEKHGN